MDQTQPELVRFLQASPEDSEKLASLAEIIWRQHFTPIIGKAQVDYMLTNFQSAKAITKFIHNGYEYYFITLADSPIGYLAIQNRDDHLHLSKFYIREEFRGRGIGSKALVLISNKAKEYRLPSIKLVVNKDNSDAINIYLRYGFVKTGSSVTDIGGGFVMDDDEFELRIN